MLKKSCFENEASFRNKNWKGKVSSPDLERIFNDCSGVAQTILFGNDNPKTHITLGWPRQNLEGIHLESFWLILVKLCAVERVYVFNDLGSFTIVLSTMMISAWSHDRDLDDRWWIMMEYDEWCIIDHRSLIMMLSMQPSSMQSLA